MASKAIIDTYVRKITRAVREAEETGTEPTYTIDNVPTRIREEVRIALEEESEGGELY